MLVLKRQLGEKITVGEGRNQVVITVVDITRGQVRLGFEADRGVPIYRDEYRPVDPPSSDKA